MKFGWFTIAMFVVAVSLLSGCAGTSVSDAAVMANQSAKEAGSPYRWEYRRNGDYDVLTKRTVGVVADTTADTVLAEFTRKQISAIENTKHISPEQKPNQVRIVSKSEADAQEVWVYEIDNTTQAFVVSYVTSVDGGTDVSITGPW